MHKHLDQCECCQAKLEELATGGTNLSQLVEKLHEAETVAESPIGRPFAMHQAAGRATGSRRRHGSHNRPAITTAHGMTAADFLLPPNDPAYIGRLAHFDVMHMIGRGGMGIVLEAFDSKLQRNVALNMLIPTWPTKLPASLSAKPTPPPLRTNTSSPSIKSSTPPKANCRIW